VGTRLGQTTLNPYLDYYDVNWNRRSSSLTNLLAFVPSHYGRASDLHFYSGPATNALGTPAGSQQGHGIFFFAPLGYSNNTAAYADVPSLLNAIGYYVEWGSDLNYRPALLGSSFPQKYRYRLIENILPTQNFTYYTAFTTSPSTYANYMVWINTGLENNTSTSGKNILADNVIALIVRPEMSQQDATTVFGSGANPWNLTTNYLYDSRTLVGEQRPAISTSNPSALWYAQLPPLLRVVMVAVDEPSARRLTTGTTPPAAFQLNSTWFQNPANLDADLNSLSQQLSGAHVSFQIFNQLIPIRGAEFSTQSE